MEPDTILELQKKARPYYVIFSAVLLFLHNTGLGGCFVYGSLTLYHHRDQNSTSENRYFMYLTEDQGSNYMSIVPLLNLFGSILGYPAAEFFGRKPVLMVTNVLQIIGFLIMYFSTSFLVLMIGRSLTCFALGFGVMTPFILTSEITTIKQRAPLSTINTQSISFGILAAFFFVFLFPTEYLIFFLMGESSLFLLLSIFLPESPHFLVRKGRLEEAENTYRRLRGKDYDGIGAEIKEVIDLISKETDVTDKPKSRWIRRNFLQPLVILMFLMFFIAMNGVDCPLNFYGPYMFKEFGFTISPSLISCLIPAGQLLGYSFAPFIMSLISKKAQYFLACAVMTISACSLGLAYYAKSVSFEPVIVQQVLLASGSLGLTFGYGVGFGSVSYAMPGELLSPSDKAIGISIAQCVRMIATTVLIKVIFYISVIIMQFLLDIPSLAVYPWLSSTLWLSCTCCNYCGYICLHVST